MRIYCLPPPLADLVSAWKSQDSTILWASRASLECFVFGERSCGNRRVQSLNVSQGLARKWSAPLWWTGPAKLHDRAKAAENEAADLDSTWPGREGRSTQVRTAGSSHFGIGSFRLSAFTWQFLPDLSRKAFAFLANVFGLFSAFPCSQCMSMW